MKRIISMSTLGLVLAVSGSAFAGEKHPNLAKAHKHLEEAAAKITAAQKANEYDLGGHAAKAKDLIDQAMAELKQAREAANDNAPKK